MDREGQESTEMGSRTSRIWSACWVCFSRSDLMMEDTSNYKASGSEGDYSEPLGERVVGSFPWYI